MRKVFFNLVCVIALSLASAASARLYQNPFQESFDPQWSRGHSNFFIHSIPKCGTHYIQRIIHLMFPQDIFTGEISYAKLQEINAGGMIFRSHDPFSREMQEMAFRLQYRCISMVRDPRDALISHLVYMDSLKHKGAERDFFTIGPGFDSLSLDDRITRLITGGNGTESYIDFYLMRIGWSMAQYSLMVRYEDLIGEDEIAEYNKMNTILQIAEFVGLDLTSDHLSFVIENMYVKQKDVQKEGKVYERASTGNWRLFLNDHHKRLLKQKIGKVLILLGYEKDDNW